VPGSASTTATFAATLCIPVAAAGGVGVAISLLLQLNREAMDLTLSSSFRTDGYQLR
jgi:sulfate permease, SulP family